MLQQRPSRKPSGAQVRLAALPVLAAVWGVLFVGTQAFAQVGSETAGTGLGSGRGSGLGPGRVVVADEVCRALVAHRPDDSVSYVPGRDVHGRPVAPADLPGRPVFRSLEGPFAIPVIVDLAERYPEQLRGMGLDLRLDLGLLTIEGRDIRLDGVPLEDPLTSAIADLCDRQDD